MNKPREQRLLHVGELLERHVLDHRWQLVVVTNHNPPLQPIVTILRVLQKTAEQHKSKTKSAVLI